MTCWISFPSYRDAHHPDPWPMFTHSCVAAAAALNFLFFVIFQLLLVREIRFQQSQGATQNNKEKTKLNFFVFHQGSD
jgi:ascorbate-specific PTS system EIIC-type component UlaA